MATKPLVTAVAVVLVNSQGEVLGFVHDNDMTQIGLPAGYIEPGETASEAGKRELFEETGLIALGEPELLITQQSGDNLCAAYRYRQWTGRLLTAEQVTGGDIGYPMWVKPEMLCQETFRFSPFSKAALIAAKVIAA